MEKYGYDLINDAFLNKGTAFSTEERKKYHLEGLLPPCIDDIETQADRIYRQMERKTSEIEKRRFLMDIFNHNLETVKRLYEEVRPGANYEQSLELLREYKKASNKPVVTKSGLMVGLGEEVDEILGVMEDLRRHDVSMLTVGQYLQPSVHHLPVKHYYTPEQFQIFTDEGLKMGFTHVASGPMVRSSFHADMSAKAVLD